MYQSLGKRVLDILISGSALLLLSPIITLLALIIWLEDRGHPVFSQTRVGRHGNPFTLYKFRSMPINTGDVPSSEAHKIKITRIGRMIRRTNLDELPQLFNILKGDMSIVGPRPALSKQAELIDLRNQYDAYACTPGLTGLAQINSYDNMPDAEKAKWDGEYRQNVSFVTDLTIIFRTFGYLLKPPPVY